MGNQARTYWRDDVLRRVGEQATIELNMGGV